MMKLSYSSIKLAVKKRINSPDGERVESTQSGVPTPILVQSLGASSVDLMGTGDEPVVVRQPQPVGPTALGLPLSFFHQIGPSLPPRCQAARRGSRQVLCLGVKESLPTLRSWCGGMPLLSRMTNSPKSCWSRFSCQSTYWKGSLTPWMRL